MQIPANHVSGTAFGENQGPDDYMFTSLGSCVMRPEVRAGLGYGERSAPVSQEFQAKTRLFEVTIRTADKMGKQFKKKTPQV
jgi:hypothetical protein